jgi:hypothetical protein
MHTVLLDETAPISFVFNLLAIFVFAGCYISLLSLLLTNKIQGYRWGMSLASGLAFIGLGALEIGVLPIPLRYYFLVFLFPFLVGLSRLLLRTGKLP